MRKMKKNVKKIVSILLLSGVLAANGCSLPTMPWGNKSEDSSSEVKFTTFDSCEDYIQAIEDIFTEKKYDLISDCEAVALEGESENIREVFMQNPETADFLSMKIFENSKDAQSYFTEQYNTLYQYCDVVNVSKDKKTCVYRGFDENTGAVMLSYASYTGNVFELFSVTAGTEAEAFQKMQELVNQVQVLDFKAEDTGEESD